MVIQTAVLCASLSNWKLSPMCRTNCACVTHTHSPSHEPDLLEFSGVSWKAEGMPSTSTWQRNTRSIESPHSCRAGSTWVRPGRYYRPSHLNHGFGTSRLGLPELRKCKLKKRSGITPVWASGSKFPKFVDLKFRYALYPIGIGNKAQDTNYNTYVL